MPTTTSTVSMTGSQPPLSSKSTINSRPPNLTANVPVSQVTGTPKEKTPILPKKTGTDDKSSKVEGQGAGTPSEVDTPKAVVKPNVLTHIIDGHVIQESSQPFPMDDSKGKSR